MKIFIVHAPAGAGHRRAAEAIKQAFDNAKTGHDVRLIDSLKYTNPLFSRSYVWGYDFLVSEATIFWGVFFYLTDFRPLHILIRFLRLISNFLNGFRFYGLILKEKPDCVVSTHFFSTEVISNLKRLRLFRGKLITCVTDYGVHEFWVSGAVDLYVVASEYSKKQLIKKGIKDEKIRVLGIPVQHKFTGKTERGAVIQKLGLKGGLFNILIMGGGLGVGPIFELTKIISESGYPFQLIVVCGNNRRLCNQIESFSTYSSMPIKVYGFVDNINEVMSASDVIISKPGGLSISEALIKGLPVLVTTCIPGHEAKNLKFLEKNSVGIKTRGIVATLEKLKELYNSPDILNSMREKAKQLGRPSAASDIVLLVLQAIES